MKKFVLRMTDYFDRKLEATESGRARAARYRANPSLWGLAWGALLGVVNGLVLDIFLMNALPGAADYSLALMVANISLFTGMFVGGSIGLVCHAKEYSLGKMLALLAGTEYLLFRCAIGLVMLELILRAVR